MSTALINPQILKWARQRSQISLDILAKRASVNLERVQNWEEGKEPPTFKQAQKLAHLLHVPFGYLYLKTPPQDKVAIPDLRTMSQESPKELSVDFKDLLSDVLRKHDWYKEYLQDQGTSGPAFVGRFGIDTSPKVIAQDIVATLGLTVENRKKGHSGEDLLKQLMEKSEEAGIWVMRTGKVGNDTHRILNPDEFRGFAISDTVAPLVFINGVDAKGAQIFTLVHELAHIWLGASGISDSGLLVQPSKNHRTEKLCDQVAAEVLVPEILIIQFWQKSLSLPIQAEELSSRFGVSPVVIGRRALDLGLISKEEFFVFYNTQATKWKKIKEEQGSGGNFYKVIPITNGRRFTDAVIQQVQSQQVLLTEGAKLLGIKLGSLYKILDGQLI